MRWLSLLGLLLYSSASAQTPSTFSHGSVNSKNAIISANLASPGITIPSSFVGISGEVGDLIAGYYQGNTGSAASFLGVANLLGSNGYLRLGGISSDLGTAPALTSGIATNLATFTAGLGAGWKVIYTLDAVANNSATAATQAGLLATALGTSNVIFQFGNEPVTSGHFTNSTYATMWNAYQTAVAAAVVGALTAADDDGLSGTNGTNNQTTLSGLSVANSAQTAITFHAYEFCSPTTLGAANVLGNWQTLGSRNIGGVGYWASVTKMMVTEQNSVCNRGQTGLTDTMMQVPYYIAKASYLASIGFAAMDTHQLYQVKGDGTNGGTTPANYNPFVQQADLGFSPGTIFYGMYLFSKIAGQQIVPAAVAQNNSNVAAIATLRVAGKANILVANMDTTSPVSITPSQSSAWTTANVLKVTAGNGQGCADTNPLLGGAAILEGGSWSGTTTALANGASFTLGPCEAALVSVQ